MIHYVCDRCQAETSETREFLEVRTGIVTEYWKELGPLTGRPERLRREFCGACADAVYRKLSDALFEEVAR